ncbi:MAG TPA: hypothetical protein ACFYEF_09570 [Candidatus Wunengus sp. YC63]|uniref:hypothetical protein n=1 Tax=unclassified Candidatus Wunengus TaxID=3367695 RepID=UPI004025FACB
MAKKELNPEEQKLQVRRRLMKMAIYSIPAIATVLATEEGAYPGGGDDDDDWGSGGRKGKGPKPKNKRTKPHGPKRYPGGLS